MLKIGDTVMWRGGFGRQNPQPVKVEAIELTEQPREKYGEEVEEVSWDAVRENRVVMTLDNGYWAYSDQIEPMP